MLLEAQGKFRPSGKQVDTQTPRSTASIAVGTGEAVRTGENGSNSPSLLQYVFMSHALSRLSGASLFWGDPVQPIYHEEKRVPPSSSPTTFSSPKRPTPSSSSPSSSCRPPSHAELAIIMPVGSAENSDITDQQAVFSPSRQLR